VRTIKKYNTYDTYDRALASKADSVNNV